MPGNVTVLTNPPGDLCSDEQLILAYYAGNREPFKILFLRYYTFCLAYLQNHSRYKKDMEYLCAVRASIMEITMSRVKHKKFEVRGEGAFSAYFYTAAEMELWNADKKRRHTGTTMTDAFPKSETKASDDIILDKVEPVEKDNVFIKHKLSQVHQFLTPFDIHLMQLVGDGLSYAEILARPEFKDWNLDKLKRKVCNIRKQAKEFPV